MAWISALFTNPTTSRFFTVVGICLVVYGFVDIRELDSKTDHALRVLVVAQAKVAREIRALRISSAAEKSKQRRLWTDALTLDAENSVLERQKRELAVESKEGQDVGASAFGAR